MGFEPIVSDFESRAKRLVDGLCLKRRSKDCTRNFAILGNELCVMRRGAARATIWQVHRGGLKKWLYKQLRHGSESDSIFERRSHFQGSAHKLSELVATSPSCLLILPPPHMCLSLIPPELS
jgi:hypothetical protein